MIKPTPSDQRWWDITALLLLLAALLTAASRLAATRWTYHLSITQNLVMMAAILGVALGYSRFSARAAGWLAFFYGLCIIPWQMGAAMVDGFPWLERMSILLSRLGIIIYQLINSHPVQDSLLFLVIMYMLFWALAVFAGFQLARHGDAWVALLPVGLTVFVIHTFDPLVPRRTWYLAVFLFFALVLVARMAFVRQHTQWQRTRTALPPHLSLDFVRYTVMAAALIVIFSWSVPALASALPQAEAAFQPVRESWARTLNRFENLFASLQSSAPIFSQVYGDTAMLGRGSQLSDAQVFAVRAPANVPDGARLYWRARTFELYEQGQWYSRLYATRPFDPEVDPLPLAAGLGSWAGSFEIISGMHMGTVFSPPQPLWISREGEVEAVDNPDGTVDISMFVASPPVTPGEVYQAQAYLAAPSVEMLQQAGEDYPQWIKERYLQVPDSITPRTRQLAEQLTAGLETPYDKAVAITSYLRENITYTEILPDDPPESQEPIDWFLFDLKQGFCNYYATAEVMLLRLAGIPARWSVGFAQGEQMDNTIAQNAPGRVTYLVRQRDAHAWPEAYFPGIGWVEFEPTTAQPLIVRPSAGPSIDLETSLPPDSAEREPPVPDEDLESLRDRENQAAEAAARQNRSNVVYWILTVVAAVLLGLAVLRLLPLFGFPAVPMLLQSALLRAGYQPPEMITRWAEHAEARQAKLAPGWAPRLLEKAFIRFGLRPPRLVRSWVRQAELPPVSKAYLEINRALGRLGQAPAAPQTPAERAGALGNLLPPAQDPAQALLAEYQVHIFSQRPSDAESARQAASRIRRLSYQALFKRWFARFQRKDRSQPALLRTNQER